MYSVCTCSGTVSALDQELAGGGAILIRLKDRVVPVADIEQAITELTHVRSAGVVTDDRGGILEVHVVASDEHPAKQVARDVGSLLVARLGIPLDHRKISVAQVSADEPIPEVPRPARAAPVETTVVPEEPEAAPVPEPVLRNGTHLESTDTRIRFVGVSVKQAEDVAEVRVELEMGGLESVALVRGADTPASLLRTVSEAVLEATQQFFEPNGIFTAHGVEVCTAGGVPVMVTNICHVSERSEKQLIGACAVGGDPPLAAALSTLDAINRYLRRLRRKAPMEYEIGPASD